jgi:hypothetical protein
MRDQFTFLERFDVSEACGQPNVEQIDRERRQRQKHHSKRQRHPNNPLLQLRCAQLVHARAIMIQ